MFVIPRARDAGPRNRNQLAYYLKKQIANVRTFDSVALRLDDRLRKHTRARPYCAAFTSNTGTFARWRTCVMVLP